MAAGSRLYPPDVGAGRSLSEVLGQSHAAVEPAMHEAVGTMPESMRRIAGYHLGWWSEDGTPIAANGGKGIRPALVLLAAEAAGGPAEAAVPAAVAVGLVHDFSLIHDDVLDGDHTRRHRPTAWTVFGIGGAILAGNGLLACGFEVLAASGHAAACDCLGMLSAAVLALLDGQSADIAFEARTDVTLAECLDMTRHKTGALLACACGLGATFGGGTPDQVRLLQGFGGKLGLAFQHVDDLLGIWGDPSLTGKPVHSDLSSYKKTLPVVAALTSATPAGRELAALYRGDDPLSGASLVLAAELIDAAGGRAWSEAQVDQLLLQALDYLEAAGPPARAAAELAELARLIVRRDH